MNDSKKILSALERVMNEPDNPDRYDSAGMMLLGAGDDKNAERYLQRAYELSPSNPTVLSHYAQILSIRSRWRESAGLWRKYLKLRPGEQAAIKNLADCCYRLGDYQEAANLTNRLNQTRKGT